LHTRSPLSRHRTAELGRQRTRRQARIGFEHLTGALTGMVDGGTRVRLRSPTGLPRGRGAGFTASMTGEAERPSAPIPPAARARQRRWRAAPDRAYRRVL